MVLVGGGESVGGRMNGWPPGANADSSLCRGGATVQLALVAMIIKGGGGEWSGNYRSGLTSSEGFVAHTAPPGWRRERERES